VKGEGRGVIGKRGEERGEGRSRGRDERVEVGEREEGERKGL
jgi:hypothetical protein